MSSDQDGPDAAVDRLQDALGLPPGFFATLVHENDWFFVIKLHAIIEAAFAFVISHKLGDEVADVVSELDMNGRKGKVAFALALNLINKDEVRFLHLLSGLRNRCAHGIIQAVQFSLGAYVEGLNRDQRQEFLRACVCSDPKGTMTLGDTTTSRQRFVLDNPKLAIWLTALNLLAILHVQKETADIIRRSERAMIEWWQRFTPPPPVPVKIAGPFGNFG